MVPGTRVRDRTPLPLRELKDDLETNHHLKKQIRDVPYTQRAGLVHRSIVPTSLYLLIRDDPADKMESSRMGSGWVVATLT